MKKPKLTEREIVLLSHIAKDNWISNKELADKMNICVGTVKYFIGSINKKLKTKERRDLVGRLAEKIYEQ